MAERTRQQLEDAARFMGGTFSESATLGPMLSWRGENGGGYIAPWEPLSEWDHFGPLLVLLLRWRTTHGALANREVSGAKWRFIWALEQGTEQELMQAGVPLAAAIGATMREEK